MSRSTSMTPFYPLLVPSFPGIRGSIFNISYSTGRYSMSLPLPQKIAFLRPHGFPFCTGSLYLGIGADFSNWHIPPALITGHALIAVVLDVDHRCTLSCSHRLECNNEISVGLALDHMRTQAARIRRQVNAQFLHIRARRVTRQNPIARSSIAGAEAILT